MSCIKSKFVQLDSMKAEQVLQQEIKDIEIWLCREKDECTYKRDLEKRNELINWVLENMKNPEVQICSLIESRMNENIQAINKRIHYLSLINYIVNYGF